MATGTVVNLKEDRGFGFIRPDGAPNRGKDVFFHVSGCNDGFNALAINDRVSYLIEAKDGRDRAIHVKKLPRGA